MRYSRSRAVALAVVVSWGAYSGSAHAQEVGVTSVEEDPSATVDDSPLEVAPHAGDVSLEGARRAIRRNLWSSGVFFGVLGAAELAAGVPLVVRSDREASPSDDRRIGVGVLTLAFGTGHLVSAVISFVTMARHRDTQRVPTALREARGMDRRWLRILMPLVAGGFLAGGLTTFALADDPFAQGAGLAFAAQSVSIGLSLAVGAKGRRRLRPFYPLAASP